MPSETSVRAPKALIDPRVMGRMRMRSAASAVRLPQQPWRMNGWINDWQRAHRLSGFWRAACAASIPGPCSSTQAVQAAVPGRLSAWGGGARRWRQAPHAFTCQKCMPYAMPCRDGATLLIVHRGWQCLRARYTPVLAPYTKPRRIGGASSARVGDRRGPLTAGCSAGRLANGSTY